MADETTSQEAMTEDATDEAVEEMPVRELLEDPILAGLAESFTAVEFTSFEPIAGPRQDTATVSRDELLAFVQAVKDGGFETFIDLCAVDHLNRVPRYDVVIVVLSMERAQRLIIKVGIPGDEPTVASITSVYTGANFYEREAWDLFGIVFEGHTDLTRILLPDEWEGHPLRKNYSVGAVPVQFKDSYKAP